MPDFQQLRRLKDKQNGTPGTRQKIIDKHHLLAVAAVDDDTCEWNCDQIGAKEKELQQPYRGATLCDAKDPDG
jgi:hypothetical protein